MVAGVFGLKRVYKKQKLDEWPEDPNFGYFGGGYAPSSLSTIDRLDFSNETTSNPPANLPEARQGLAAVSNSSYGYFGGGGNPDPLSSIDRLDFSSETTNSIPTTNLPQARVGLAAVSN